MCSLNDIDGNCETFVFPEKQSIRENTTCRSCLNVGFVVLRKKDVYCKNCFLAAETHKFRAALGKSKIMKPQDKVLVAFSGSQSSTALLHFLHSGVTEHQHKKLLFSVLVFFIDENALFSMKVCDRKKIVERVKDTVAVYDFPLLVSSLSESLKESPVVESALIIDEEYDKQLISLFTSVKTFTSKEDLLNLLRQKLILKAAEQLKCNKVFSAEVGTDMAIKLLSNFSLGRGATASFETGFCDSRHPNIKILRPLRDFTRKEIAFYNKCQNIEALSMLSITTKSPSSISIQKLTEKFVTDLQENFPSTVYTIFRTGEKLNASTVDEEMNDNICILCKYKITTYKDKRNYSALEAANFSRKVSRKKLNSCRMKEKGNCCGSCAEVVKTPDIDAVDLEKFLCYSCILIVRDLKSINALPKDTLQVAVQKKNFEDMKAQISEFLIDSSSEVEV